MNLTFLKNSEHWFGDGTFKVTDLFYQLYTIHALTENYVIPCVYVLLPHDTAGNYVIP